MHAASHFQISSVRERSIELLPGQYFDRETGALYNVNRDYDPGVGRYLEFDPLGLGSGLNGYLYVDANPIGEIDPDGLLSTNKPAPPPGQPWKGTRVPGGDALKALKCIEKCTGSFNLQISGGNECTDDGRHQPGTIQGSRHCTDQAFDIYISWVQAHGTNKVLCCAKGCGVKYIQIETVHYHFQTVPGGGGGGGLVPPSGSCGCS
jgi:RHS repeat-associated protein